MRILITGGAGFVGGAIAKFILRTDAKNKVVLLDNLRRRGSELNVPLLTALGATFVHGDVRNPADLEALEGRFDVLIEASAEASVHAGIDDSPRYVLDTNIQGAIHCLEFARRRCGGVVFLSSSRVYSIAPLRSLELDETPSRFELKDEACRVPGIAAQGVSEFAPSDGPRSYYGASKLAGELLCQEYSAHAGLPVVINRCGVIAGPGQFGRTDQGVFTLWLARHHFRRPLQYTGFGGRGLQVRDLLHPADLTEIIRRQLDHWSSISGKTFNVGGGRSGSVSLREYTEICRDVTGRSVEIGEVPGTSPVDIPWYISDHRKATEQLGWSPKIRPREIADEIHHWLLANESTLSAIIA